jgi:hypothetical protein
MLTKTVIETALDEELTGLSAMKGTTWSRVRSAGAA